MSKYNSSTIRSIIASGNVGTYDKNISRSIGLRAAVVYGALREELTFLWRKDDLRKQIINNDYFFFWKKKYLAQEIGCHENKLGSSLDKLVQSGLLEKKLDKDPLTPHTRVSYYRLHLFVDSGNLPKRETDNLPKRETPAYAYIGTARTKKKENIRYKEENKSVAPLRVLMGTSKRTSVPGESKHSKMELPRGVSERLYQYTKFIDEKIRANRVGEYSSAEIEKRVWDGAVELNRLITKEKVTFTQIKEVLEWAATNTFWKANFQSVARLRAKSKNGEIKFQNMYSAFVLEQEKNAPMEEKIQSEIIDRLKSKTFASRQERESKMETHCEDVAGIRDWMTTLSTLAIQKGKPPANFQNLFPTLKTKIIPFVIWLDDEMYGARESVTTYNEAWDIIYEYLQYIKERLDKITLGPWLFEIGSKDFYAFLKETGIKHVLRRHRNDC
jgi:hypothetical protein